MPQDAIQLSPLTSLSSSGATYQWFDCGNHYAFSEVSIFPNPTNGKVSINVGSTGSYGLKVFSSNGRLIYQNEEIQGEIYQFDLDAPPGIYFINLSQ
jgi:hypothetical protein